MNTSVIIHKIIILYKYYISPNFLSEQVITPLMACQAPLLFFGIKYSNFLHFHCQFFLSVLYEKDSIEYIYDYVENPVASTNLLGETPSTNTLSPNIA